MTERRGKLERNLEEELDKLLAEIEQKVPDLPTSGLSDLQPLTPTAPASVAAAPPGMKVADPTPVAAPAAASTAGNAGNMTTEDEIAALIAAASGGTEPGPAVAPTIPVPETVATPVPPPPPAGMKAAMSEDALSAQIQSLLDQAITQDSTGSPSRPSAPSAATPQTPDDVLALDEFASPHEVLAETTSSPTSRPSNAEPAGMVSHASAIAPGHTEVAQILEQIDDDLSKQADEAIAGEFETVQDVVGDPSPKGTQAAVTPRTSVGHDEILDDPARIAQALGAQVAAELDSQPEATMADEKDQATPIPTIPPEVLAAANAPAPRPSSTVSAKSKADANNTTAASVGAAGSGFRFSLRLPPILPTLRAVMTLLNAPLINADPSLRQAVGLLGLGNLMLGSMWVLWVLITRH